MKQDPAIKRVFNADRNVVASYLRHVVSDGLLDSLDLSTLRRMPSEWVSANLVRRFGDSAWVVDYGGGGRTFAVFFHFEFQSRTDPSMPFRMLTYAALQYEALWQSRRRTGLAPGRMPTVISAVLYTGGRRWDVPTRVESMLDSGDAEIARFQPRYGYAVIDEAGLVSRGEARPDDLAGALMLMRHSRRVDARLMRALEFVEDSADAESEAYRELAGEVSKRLFKRNREVRTMEQLRQEADAMWSDVKEQGVKRGVEQSVRRVLASRFGEIPSAYDRFIAEADQRQLERWLDRALCASSVDSVFKDGSG